MTSSLPGPTFVALSFCSDPAWRRWMGAAHGWSSRHRALAQQGTPAGQMTWAMHITLAPTWFDPAQTALLTPYLCLRALHDALVKPMPDGPMAPCLATRWHESGWLDLRFRAAARRQVPQWRSLYRRGRPV